MDDSELGALLNINIPTGPTTSVAVSKVSKHKASKSESYTIYIYLPSIPRIYVYLLTTTINIIMKILRNKEIVKAFF